MNNKLKPNHISDYEFRKFGIDPEKNLKIHENLDEIRKYPPNIIIAKCIKDVSFVQNYFMKQELKKNNNYAMSLGVYQQLKKNPQNGDEILKPADTKFSKLYKPYLGEDLNNKKIIISRTGGTGDILGIQPSMLYLKNKYPSCKIIFGCGPQYQDMVKEWDCVDEIINLPYNIKRLYESDYQAIFEGIVERNKEAERINFYKLFSMWLNLDIPDNQLIPIQKPNKDKLKECRDILKNEFNLEENKFIIIQPRASSIIRSPNPLLWKNIINKLHDVGYDIVMLDSPKNANSIDRFITDHIKQKNKIFNFCKYSKDIGYAIAIISLCELVLSVDSSSIHIAGSLKKPVFGLYGAFKGELRMKYFEKADWIDCKGSCPSAPCFRHGNLPCPYNKNGFGMCYDSMNIDELIERIKKLV